MKMHLIRITENGWGGYTGPLSDVDFVNGVSTEVVPQKIMDRIAGLISIEAVDEDGNNDGQIGAQVRLIEEALERAPVESSLARQTDQERELERKTVPSPIKIDKFYSLEELELIAGDSGMKGLRPIGDLLGVKARSIPDLIEMIIGAQNARQKRAEGDINQEPVQTQIGKTEEKETV